MAEKSPELSCLAHVVEAAQRGGQNEMVYLLDKFKPLILKYARLLHEEDGESEMTLAFIEIIHRIPLPDFTGVDASYRLLAYIKASVRNAFAAMARTHLSLEKEHCQLDERVTVIAPESSPGYFEFWDLIHFLSPSRQKILAYRYLYGYSDSEIASRLSVSRQAVNKARNKALGILRDRMDKS